jgi:hypothetical protein
MIEISLGLAQTSGDSFLIRRQVLPWANADRTKTSEGMNVRFMLHHQQKILNIEIA